ncbi:hypothetical protein SEMRO_25_G017390.1 [Seminavis robusta]|uniref:Uncharacterized protein n=1 Tax=Seminavis robusta TaxID=568900 RepID=A0A9N8D9P0_9STRA|nr:hypothetical protein SEMRO_25_G017390.1 [Seminavis robusta]|eukprot:Sro25_g017390.1 n/a (274) ;mRNA; r:171979-172800
MEQEFISITQEGLKRRALVALTDNYIDGYFVDLRSLEKEMWNWSRCVFDICEHYMDAHHGEGRESQVPNWFHHDDILIRVTKVALESMKKRETTNPGMIIKMTCIQAQVLSNRVYDISKKFKNMVKNRTPQQLLEASALYRSLSKDGPASISEFFESQAAALEGTVRAHQDSKQGTSCNDNDVPVIRAHAWVILRGLTSPSGSAMNGKLGLVCENGLQHGRHLVTVDGYDGVKCIKPENLVEIPVEEYREALISTLGEGMQWRFMRNLVEHDA